MLEVVDRFFKGFDEETILEKDFTQRVEYFENAIFGLSDNQVLDSDLPSGGTSKFIWNSEQPRQ